MSRFVLVIILNLFVLGVNYAQQKALICFTDKAGVSIDPEQFYDQKAIDRRLKHHLPLVTFNDLPVNTSYLNELNNFVIYTKVVSRWLNGTISFINTDQIENIERLPFVKSVEILQSLEPQITSIKEDTLSYNSQKLLSAQLTRMGHRKFRSENITGQGVRVAIFDVGFKNVDVNEAFRHIRESGRIIKTWNFVSNNENVFKVDYHGTNVLSCIAGKNGNDEIGLAIGAEFLLAKTERKIWEPFSEEENWLAAAEWADQNGADIISSSLGYGYNRYFNEDMDGHTSLVSMAARIATRKGILVVNSAGNEGQDRWYHMITPADVDSVLSIGGIDPYTGIGISFTSLGPNAKNQKKPNVCAFGSVMASGKHEWGMTQGTSFSCPLISGYAACLLQANPKLTNMELFKAIEESSDLYPYYDYRHGHGVPNAELFFNKKNMSSTFQFLEVSDGSIECNVEERFFHQINKLVKSDTNNSVKAIPSTTSEYSYAFEGGSNETFNGYGPRNNKIRSSKRECFYYRLEDATGRILFFKVIDLFQPKVLKFKNSDIPEGGKVVAHYRGYTAGYKP